MKTPSTAPAPQRRRWLAGLVALALALGGSLTAVAPALADGGPTVTVTEAPREGGAVTVVGSGFTADATGVYVGVGAASSVGFYSAGIAESGTIWVATDLAATATRAPMSADGSFELQLQVPAVGDTELAVFTSRAHGGGMRGDLSQDTKTVVVYAAPAEEPGTEGPGTGEPGTGEPGAGEPGAGEPGSGEPGTEEPGTGEPGTGEPGTGEPGTEEPGTGEPEAEQPVLSLSKSVGLAAEGETVTVTGEHYNPSQAMYLTLCTDVPLEEVSFGFISAGCTAGAKLVTPSPRSPSMVKLEADGTFTTQFTVTSKGASTAVYTIADHTAMQDRSQDAKVTVTFAPPKPVLSLSKSVGLDAEGETVTVTGEHYNPSQALYLTLCTDVPLEEVSFGFISAGCTAGAKLVTPSPRSPSMVKLEADGTFTTQFTVTSKGASTAMYTIADHTAMQDRSQDAKVTVTFAPPEPTGPVLTVTPSTDVDSSKDNTFTITGSGYTGAGAAFGAYVLLGDAAIWSGDGPLIADGWLAQAWVRPAQIVDGEFTTTITIPKGSFDGSKHYVVASSAAHGLSVTDRSLDAFAPIALQAGTTPPTTPTTPPTKPVTPSKPSKPSKPAKPTIPGGSLSWGVSKDFTDYVTGTIAKGSITVTGGATQSGGVYQFGQTGGSFTATANRGTAEYGGTIGFSGHGGELSLTFADPTLRVMSPTAGILSVVVDGTRVDLASVDLGAAARSTSNGSVRFAGAPVTLLQTGVAAFNGFYVAGHALAPLTAVLGAPAAAPAGETGVVATVAAAKPARSIPGTPPATTGIDLDQATLAALVAGEQVTVSAGGFEPNESDIHVVVYSEPIVLARDLQADADGVVTWTGALPAGLEAGEHTLTFQGSAAKGVRFTLAEPSGQCTVAGATLDWGVKESFRSYLSSGIANGSWEVQGATETDGVFGFTGGKGAFDESAERGTVAFGGGIRFTGHDGVLDTTVSNPGLEFDGTAVAYLTLDVSGTTQDGTPVEAKRVRFAELDLSSGFVAEAGSLAGTAVPATLTADGAAAFGTYGAGEELDPVTFVVPLAADCGVVAVAAVDDEGAASVAIDDEPTADASAEATGLPSWTLWAGLGLLVVALIALVIVLLVRARRSAA